MIEKPEAPSITAERHGAAIIARANVKLLAEQELKTLSRLIDQGAGGAGVTLVVIDLTGVQLLQSLAMGLLMQISRKCKASNQAAKLACVDRKCGRFSRLLGWIGYTSFARVWKRRWGKLYPADECSSAGFAFGSV